MKKGICFFMLLAAMFLLPAYRIAPYNIEKIYAELEMRQLKDGKSITFKGEICYEGNGNMTSHYYYPRNYVLLSNKTGEIKLYDPAANTVVLSQNNQFSSQTSQFYTFLSGKQADMGVNELGYVQEKVSMENGLVVSIWKLKKADKKRPVQKIKLVHQNGNPIYMHYEKADGGIVRKVFYYGFTPLEHISFPATSTEIAYGDKDSMITKTSFRNFKINQEAVSSYFNYKIPGNAKIQRF